MNNQVIKNYKSIQEYINQTCNDQRKVNIVSVTKTFKIDVIKPLIDSGAIHFGENKVQEALTKWSDIKTTNKNIKLHMIGKLQTNKVKKAIPLFDYLHSLDNLKLAESLHKYESQFKKKLKYFVQVNLANENQKSGINLNNLNSFLAECTKKYNLKIIGLMCMPPLGEDHNYFFKKISDLNDSCNLKDLSIGMSNDYKDALKFNSTYIRVGSAIFGSRS